MTLILSLFSTKTTNIPTYSVYGSRLALSLLFLNVKIEAALAELRWSRWRLDGILLGRNKSEQQLQT